MKDFGDRIISSQSIETAMIPLIKLAVQVEPDVVIHVDLTLLDSDEPNKLLRLEESITFVQECLMMNVGMKPVILFLKKLLLN